MRAFLIGVFVMGIVAALLLLLLLRKPIPVRTEPTISSAPTPSPPSQSRDISVEGGVYRVAWLAVDDPSTLRLIPNYSRKRTARSLIDANECSKVINAGFYTKDNRPTGLFITQGITVRGDVFNTLFNGYVVIDENNTAWIRQSPPDAPARIAVQTGPILIRNGKLQRLSIRDDEPARRIVVSVTQTGTVMFLTIYDPKNIWSGPKLADTPGALTEFISLLQLQDAINLDGGSASSFMRGDLSLEELTSVGSFFCIR